MFDYDSPSVPDTAVADVVAAIRSHGQLPPLSDEGREQRRIANELYRRKCQQREEQRAFEYRERQAEGEAIARAEQAAEIAEANRKRTLERQAQIDKAANQSALADLQFRVRSHQVWQTGVQNAVRNQMAEQYRHTLMGELDALVSPTQPQPPDTDDVIIASDDLGSPNIADENFNPGYWLQKPIFRR
jgi:hypothetical protein